MSYDLYITRADSKEALREGPGRFSRMLGRAARMDITPAEYRAFIESQRMRHEWDESYTWLFDDSSDPLCLAEYEKNEKGAAAIHLEINYSYGRFPTALMQTVKLGFGVAQKLGAQLLDADGYVFDSERVDALLGADGKDGLPEHMKGKVDTWAHVQGELVNSFNAPLELPFRGADYAREYFLWMHSPRDPVNDRVAFLQSLDCGPYEVEAAGQSQAGGVLALVRVGGKPVARLEAAASGRVAAWPYHHPHSNFREKAKAVLHFVDEFERRAPGRVELVGIPITPDARAKIERHVSGLGVEFWIFLHTVDNGLPPLPE